MSQKQIKTHILNLINNGVVVKKYYIKNALVTATKAKGGEFVITKLEDGTTETQNVAKKGDYIITNPDGETYVISKHKFFDCYKKTKQKNIYKPNNTIKSFIKINKDCAFIAPWNEVQFIRAGGYINVSDFNDIYGVAEKEFFRTYIECI